MTIVGIVPDLLMQGIGNNNASPVGYYIPIAQSDVANGVRIAVRTRGDAAVVDPADPLCRDVARSEPRDLRDQHDAPCDRASDLVLHGVRHVLHGVRHLRAASRRGRTLWRDVVRGHAADARNGRALRARRQALQLILLVMRKSIVQLAIGLLLGLVLALSAAGALQPVLYHVNPRDATVFAGVVATLAVASLVASFLPARRVAKIDPVKALATE